MTEKSQRHVADTTQNVASWAQKRHADIRHVELSAAVTTYWVKKYKAHKKFNRDQSATNEYESAAYTTDLPPNSVPTEVDTYVSALEDIIARQMVDREDALTINTTTATPATSMAGLAAHGGSQSFGNLGIYIDGNQWRWRRWRWRKALRAARKGQGWKPITNYQNVQTATNRPRTRPTIVSA
jgi:hypothetical protein